LTHSKWTTIFLVLLAILFFAAAAWRIEPVQQQRAAYDFEPLNPYADSDIASEFRLPLPALFIFRPLAINYLWMRADDLKNNGQYFDALHLARLICALQPNLATVWDFQAWNMAYNISVAVPTPPERWNWVRAGFEILRDEAIPINPQNPELYRSLAWIFQHKIGGISDDYHRYYKQRMAYDLAPLLGSGDAQEIQELAQAPLELSELLEDLGVADLVEKFKQVDPKLRSNSDVVDSLFDVLENQSDYSPDYLSFLQGEVQSLAFIKLNRFARAGALRRDWKLDPNQMAQLNRRYGPVDYEHEGERFSLDWRHPLTHAIYWASQGLEIEEMKHFSRLSLNRIIYHSLQGLFHYGRIQLIGFRAPAQATERQQGRELIDKPDTEGMQVEIFLTQDLRMFPIAYQATLDLLEELDAEGESPGGVLDGSINLARAGMKQLYLTGYKKVAQQYLVQLHRRYPDREIFQAESIEIFVRNELRTDIEGMDISSKQTRNYVNGLLRQGFRFYALRDDENAHVRNQWAEQMFKVFKSDYPDEDNRMNIPFSELRWISLNDFLNDPLMPSTIKGLLIQRLEIEKPQLYQRVINQLEQ
jgi:hypothetical protein